MSSAPSLFTEAIEEHLALKKQNAHLSETMPLAQFSTGDPLDRYPGGPVRPALGHDEPAVTVPTVSDAPMASDAAIAAAVEPLNGMTPMLSLVEDIEQDMQTIIAPPLAHFPEGQNAEVLRLPGSVGFREVEEIGIDSMQMQDTMISAPAPAIEIQEFVMEDDAPTGEHPVIVIDADEPLAPITAEPMVAPLATATRTKKSGLLGGFRRNKKRANTGVDDNGWFGDNSPREFSWDD